MKLAAGARLRDAVIKGQPLQIIGTVNAYSALLAERAGFKAIYLSVAGVANASFGLPDLGITSLNDVCEDTRAEPYDVLGYHDYEKKLDDLFGRESS